MPRVVFEISLTGSQAKALRHIGDGKTYCFGGGWGNYRMALRSLEKFGWVRINKDDDKESETYEITVAGRNALENLED